MNRSTNDHEYGTGIEPLHHPRQPGGGAVDPDTASSSTGRKEEHCTMKSGGASSGESVRQGPYPDVTFPKIHGPGPAPAQS